MKHRITLSHLMTDSDDAMFVRVESTIGLYWIIRLNGTILKTYSDYQSAADAWRILVNSLNY